ncbi:MAG: type 1 periplasmic binding fold superfamily protein [Flavobacteriaceae bacterium]|nr:type 1 periplasmic binding fold superfamily protein [Flavobacteriaceae bacterium]|tara:strand:- start:632 stop:1192 length:561 start_codon:yes stop_codon:yes gene_type:complete
MKKYIIYTLLILPLIIVSCSKDEDDTPEPVNEEEVITTMTVTLTPKEGSGTITLQTKDLDGDGPNAPEVSVSGSLQNGVFYSGSVVFLNETETPAENITEEVEEEADEHQFFVTPGGGIAGDIGVEYLNNDSNGNTLGTQFELNTLATGNGTLTFTLRHEPKKPNTGLSDAGGETDIETTFNITVE